MTSDADLPTAWMVAGDLPTAVLVAGDLPAGTIVAVPRTGVMLVVTEYGTVCLKGKSVAGRARAMISTAHILSARTSNGTPATMGLFREHSVHECRVSPLAHAKGSPRAVADRAPRAPRLSRRGVLRPCAVGGCPARRTPRRDPHASARAPDA